ncbi:hypothetical protein EG329_007690 [Mollisiaceae sp. DMI_Dod_QoI]|nr:hypothetical protein EG329_007690 [Helotiales sp. DMI_Dod_QoI]
MSDSHILIAGQTPVDLLVYPSSNQDPTQRGQEKFDFHRCNGGASLIAEFLQASAGEHGKQVRRPAVEAPTSLEQAVTAITELEGFGKAVEPPYSFKVKRRQQLVTKPIWHPPEALPKTTDKVSILIFQDAESDFCKSNDDTAQSVFSNPNAAVDFFKESRPDTLIYHMLRPLGTGVIWDSVRNGPFTKTGSKNLERLIVVVSSDDLRAEGIDLCYGLSWEKTCEDFVEKLGSNGKLDTLATCPNLIVLFGCDGVIYHRARGRQVEEPILFFDPLSVEGRFTRRHLGPLPGIAEAFIGGLAAKISQSPPKSPLKDAIIRGFITARRLAKLGFQNREIYDRPRYPFSDIMKKDIYPTEAPITLEIPSESISRGDKRHWSILHQNIGDPIASPLPAFRICFSSIDQKLKDFVQSGFRTMFNAIHEYLSAPQKKPLNIAIFGSRGSGKSFAAGQVAEAAAAASASSRKIQHIRFNLSQITSLEDLSVAFNKVRDCNLSGTLPLVYIHDFDTEFLGHPLGWLAHLLLPMHGGQVLDRGQMQHVGPAIFLLSSGFTTSLENFQIFAANQGDERDVLRGQEFLSNLHAFVDVIGIDQVDPSDALFPVRRAVVLRALLAEREPNLKMGEGISIYQTVLDGLLLVPAFKHGLRSLKAIIAMSKVTGKHHFERAALPPEVQLSLHLDYPTFMDCSRYNTIPGDLREILSEKLHEVYRNIRTGMAKTDKEREDIKVEASLAQWALLGEEFRESTRAHVEDIPRKLRMKSLFLAEKDPDREAIENFSDEELDFFAEREHERFNAERLQKHWRLGKRNKDTRTSPFLMPW